AGARDTRRPLLVRVRELRRLPLAGADPQLPARRDDRGDPRLRERDPEGRNGALARGDGAEEGPEQPGNRGRGGGGLSGVARDYGSEIRKDATALWHEAMGRKKSRSNQGIVAAWAADQCMRGHWKRAGETIDSRLRAGP